MDERNKKKSSVILSGELLRRVQEVRKSISPTPTLVSLVRHLLELGLRQWDRRRKK